MNKTNLELKHFCSDFKPIRNVLRKIGACKHAVKNQKDYFFNLPEKRKRNPGRLKLRSEGKNNQFLIYYERPDFKKAKNTTSEIKLYRVRDKDLLLFLDESLGTSAVIEKKREVWKKANTVFHLDIVKGVGNIFEIELQKAGKISDKDKAIFKSYQDKLLPYLGDVIKGSNVDLVK